MFLLTTLPRTQLYVDGKGLSRHIFFALLRLRFLANAEIGILDYAAFTPSSLATEEVLPK